MNREKWRKDYSKNKQACWVRVRLTNGQEINFHDYDTWYEIKKICETNSVFFEEFHFQFRSHRVTMDVTDCEAVYFVRSVLGRIGGQTKHLYVFGKLKDGVIHKQLWMVPELILENSYDETIENCFEEAIIHDETKTLGEKQV